jgi:hypothetical protein
MRADSREARWYQKIFLARADVRKEPAQNIFNLNLTARVPTLTFCLRALDDMTMLHIPFVALECTELVLTMAMDTKYSPLHFVSSGKPNS